jgi:hypothetical protein
MPKELETFFDPLSEDILPRLVVSHTEDPIDIDHQALYMIRPMLGQGVPLSNTKNGWVGSQVFNYIFRCDIHLHRWRRYHCLLL